MVVKMMRWRPWPLLISRKYEVKLAELRFEGGDWMQESLEKENGSLAVEIRWKGPKFSLGSFRRSVKRNCTREENVRRVDELNGAVLVEWGEEFQTICSISGYKDNVFHPWEINFTVLHGMYQGVKNKYSVVGSAVLNLADYMSRATEPAIDIKIPLTLSGGRIEHCPFLHISLGLLELRATLEPTELLQSPIIPVPSPAASVETSSTEKDEVSALKAGFRKVKLFTEYVSTRKAKKACREEEGSDGRCSVKSEGDYAYPADSDSLEDSEDGETEENKEESTVRKSFSYGTLAHANYVGVSYYSSARISNEAEDLIYYSNRRRSDVGCSRVEDLSFCMPDKLSIENSKRSILPWRKRKLSFRSPPKTKGEPLLKKAYGEDGGDDIDFDRRQLSSDESLSFGLHRTDEDSNTNRSSVSEFGDDSFTIGTWEQKEITSRDGHMKIQTQVFFSSIDQRSERAAGESACTALVAVIADWLQNNHNLMPIKSQFDTLIRDGSLEWRNLCANDTYRELFPDKHFDLDTVIEAKIRDLCVVPAKSFIGFFLPDVVEGGNFDFLHGAMSFDSIWDEINHSSSDAEARIFIVSWNDHFFVLKVERDAYYIIDTLGERLYEGCNQAYILKFDKNTTIYKQPNAVHSSEDKPMNSTEASQEGKYSIESEEQMTNEEENEVVCRGKEACKEYIKSFLAAIPIRELEADIKKGLMKSTPLHHRLQIEFHFTRLQHD
ncbi:uncharacterized protein [Primulina huaijiensis]|uniref:uncharacterized protein n=1 Tax=Primulina huaijiensis TaxID=1492673 RepID=UPI003CC798CC